MSNAETFIRKYKDLEEIIQSKYGSRVDKSPIITLSEQPQFLRMKHKLDDLRHVRNILQHAQTYNGEYPIEPNQALLDLIDNIISLLTNPPKAFDKAIRIDRVCSATWDNKIYPKMELMKENVYTHIPILNNGIVEGVFSENTLFGALIEDELVYVKDETSFDAPLIKKHCLLDNHVSEVFKFIPKSMLLEDAKILFNKAFEKNERLAMLFITEHGKQSEKLLGIITPWDII